MVRPEGVEPPTYWFVASCSIQLSYGRTLHQRQPPKHTGGGRGESRRKGRHRLCDDESLPSPEHALLLDGDGFGALGRRLVPGDEGDALDQVQPRSP